MRSTFEVNICSKFLTAFNKIIGPANFSNLCFIMTQIDLSVPLVW